MITVCWAAKGGAGTTVTTASLALAQSAGGLLVDLAGDVPAVLGIEAAGRAGIFDWIASDAEPDRLAQLELDVTPDLRIVPTGDGAPPTSPARWERLATHLAADPRHVIVDAGTGEPPTALAKRADARLLVTRACYLALRRTQALVTRPTGVILIEEPGRALTATDVQLAVGAPVVATVLLDPKIARAADAGLLTARLPAACLDELRRAA